MAIKNMDKVYHVRVKISTKKVSKPFFIKGVSISKNETMAKADVLKGVRAWAEQEPNCVGAEILVIECKNLRSDFIIYSPK